MTLNSLGDVETGPALVDRRKCAESNECSTYWISPERIAHERMNRASGSYHQKPLLRLFHVLVIQDW